MMTDLLRFQNILRKTGKKNGFSILVLTICTGTPVGCPVAKENMRESSNEERFLQMAGDWVIDFEIDYPIEQILLADNYVPDEMGMTKEEDGFFHKARLYEAENKIWLEWAGFSTGDKITVICQMGKFISFGKLM